MVLEGACILELIVVLVQAGKLSVVGWHHTLKFVMVLMWCMPPMPIGLVSGFWPHLTCIAFF